MVEGFGVVNKAEIDVFLELSCFFDDPDKCKLKLYWYITSQNGQKGHDQKTYKK